MRLISYYIWKIESNIKNLKCKDCKCWDIDNKTCSKVIWASEERKCPMWEKK
jgi:hypothetical protein